MFTNFAKLKTIIYLLVFLINKKMMEDKQIIAPMLHNFPGNRFYSNYFYDVDNHGYWKGHFFYNDILEYKAKNSFIAPVVHCTYMINSKSIPKLTYVDGSNDYEFVIFSKSARQNLIGQYICNKTFFGYLLHNNPGSDTLEHEVKILQKYNEVIL